MKRWMILLVIGLIGIFFLSKELRSQLFYEENDANFYLNEEENEGIGGNLEKQSPPLRIEKKTPVEFPTFQIREAKKPKRRKKPVSFHLNPELWIDPYHHLAHFTRETLEEEQTTLPFRTIEIPGEPLSQAIQVVWTPLRF